MRPTPDEQSFFAANGYLQLDSFLPAALVEKLIERLRVALERRVAEHESDANDEPSQGTNPGKRATVAGRDRRIFHILDDDPEFLDLVDYADIMPYVHAFIGEKPHFHASDAIWEEEIAAREPGWHIDGADGGYRNLRPGIPMLQLKVGYYLSDMTAPDQGNLVIVPGSHRDDQEPSSDQLAGFDSLPGAVQVCGPAGTAVMFHNAMWHTRGPMVRPGGRRIMLYYAYERAWMVGNSEHWSYSPDFYGGLSPERRKLFHGFVFDPPEYRFS